MVSISLSAVFQALAHVAVGVNFKECTIENLALPK